MKRRQTPANVSQLVFRKVEPATWRLVPPSDSFLPVFVAFRQHNAQAERKLRKKRLLFAAPTLDSCGLKSGTRNRKKTITFMSTAHSRTLRRFQGCSACMTAMLAYNRSHVCYTVKPVPPRNFHNKSMHVTLIVWRQENVIEWAAVQCATDIKHNKIFERM